MLNRQLTGYIEMNKLMIFYLFGIPVDAIFFMLTEKAIIILTSQ
jgi:hypothetical protein